MNHGVQLLLARVETNPEEFKRNGKWDSLVDDVRTAKEGIRNRPMRPYPEQSPLAFLLKEEVDALYNKLSDLFREEFSANILKHLAGVDEPTLSDYEQMEMFKAEQAIRNQALQARTQQQLYQNQAQYMAVNAAAQQGLQNAALQFPYQQYGLGVSITEPTPNQNVLNKIKGLFNGT